MSATRREFLSASLAAAAAWTAPRRWWTLPRPAISRP